MITKKHPEYAAVLTSIGTCLYDLSRVDEALNKHEESKAIYEEVLGTNN